MAAKAPEKREAQEKTEKGKEHIILFSQVFLIFHKHHNNIYKPGFLVKITPCVKGKFDASNKHLALKEQENGF